MSFTTLQSPTLDRYDLLIVGGGIYGAAAAYESSRRGLSTLLVEAGDYGCASSSSSMKIVHGGLRYLQQYDVGRLLKSHGELRRLLKIAPHLVHPLQCELDTSTRGALFRLKFRAGLLAYGLLTRLARAPGCPRMPPSRYPFWQEALIDDTEQLLLDYLHTAVSLGSGKTAVRNYCRVERFRREGGQVVAAEVPGVGEIGVGAVLECTGVQRPGQAAGLSMNLVVDRLPLSEPGRALGLTHPEDGRAIFVTPWRDRSIVGTFDRDYPHDPVEPIRIEPAWVDEMLAWLAPAHPQLADLTRERIRFLHAGLLPKDAAADRELSRDERVWRTDDGRIQVLGVKYTTSRAVASRAVQIAARALGRDARGDEEPTPLVDRRAAVAGWVGDDAEWTAPLAPGVATVSRGELAFALDHEQARTLADLLLRRTGLASAGYPADEVVDAAARLVGERLGWSVQERDDQIRELRDDFRFAAALIPGASTTRS